MGRAGILQTVFILTGFYELSVKHIKTQHLWTALGFSDSNYPGIITEPDPQARYKKENTAFNLRT